MMSEFGRFYPEVPREVRETPKEVADITGEIYSPGARMIAEAERAMSLDLEYRLEVPKETRDSVKEAAALMQEIDDQQFLNEPRIIAEHKKTKSLSLECGPEIPKEPRDTVKEAAALMQELDDQQFLNEARIIAEAKRAKSLRLECGPEILSEVDFHKALVLAAASGNVTSNDEQEFRKSLVNSELNNYAKAIKIGIPESTLNHIETNILGHFDVNVFDGNDGLSALIELKDNGGDICVETRRYSAKFICSTIENESVDKLFDFTKCEVATMIAAESGQPVLTQIGGKTILVIPCLSEGAVEQDLGFRSDTIKLTVPSQMYKGLGSAQRLGSGAVRWFETILNENGLTRHFTKNTSYQLGNLDCPEDLIVIASSNGEVSPKAPPQEGALCWSDASKRDLLDPLKCFLTESEIFG
jgi:hypothetical protein